MFDHATSSRRQILQLMAGLGMSIELPGMSARAAARRADERPKSLITLWMNGGMSQLETWDPHPGTKSGGEVKDIATTAKDVRISIQVYLYYPPFLLLSRAEYNSSTVPDA